MRLASIIPRLTPPRIVRTDALPTFGSICRLSEEEKEGHPPAAGGSDKEGAGNDDDGTIPLSSVTSDISLSNLFGPKSSLPRAIFLGEQHHQPKVLSAQLQIIHELFRCCEETQKKVHVVLEHWSLTDQPYLNKLNQQDGNDFDPRSPASSHKDTSEDDDDSTSEGFSASHYLTIVKLVRELGGTVWAGFPPRPWAKLISKAEDCAFDEVQRLDKERFESSMNSNDDSMLEGISIIPPLPSSYFSSYVEKISWPHRSYLKSMFRPDLRPLALPGATKEDWQSSPPPEKRGFLAAQAIKDTYLAHTISTILESDEKNVVLAVAGLGHCEWGFGAPERLQDMMPDIPPFLIITKPDDATYWQENKFASSQPSSELPAWQNKQADAIVLYEWVD